MKCGCDVQFCTAVVKIYGGAAARSALDLHNEITLLK
jgi:hypothetical protein